MENANTYVRMNEGAKHEVATEEECIEQPARGVRSTMGKAVEGFTQGYLEDIAGRDVSEGGMSTGQAAVKVMIVRGAQSTMKNYMVGSVDKAEVGDSTNEVIGDTGNT